MPHRSPSHQVAEASRGRSPACIASLSTPGQSFRRAVPNTLILLPGRPPPEVSQSLDDMLQTAARAERRRIGPVSSQGRSEGRKRPSSVAVRAARALSSSRTKEIRFRLDSYPAHASAGYARGRGFSVYPWAAKQNQPASRSGARHSTRCRGAKPSRADPTAPTRLRMRATFRWRRKVLVASEADIRPGRNGRRRASIAIRHRAWVETYRAARRGSAGACERCSRRCRVSFLVPAGTDHRSPSSYAFPIPLFCQRHRNGSIRAVGDSASPCECHLHISNVHTIRGTPIQSNGSRCTT